MSYLPVGITEEEHRTEMLSLRRRELELKAEEVEARQGDKFWSAAGTVVSVVIPLVTFLGVASWFKIGKRK